MISIFQKKKYLVDYLEGFTDFHNHLLPGIDDGSTDPEYSLKMINRFKEFGVRSFVATPHVMGEYYPNTPETIGKALEELKDKLPADVKISAAAEYMMDQIFYDTLDSEELLTISGRHVLVEMSFFQAPINLNEILFKLQNKSYKPILAHPERYGFYHSKFLGPYDDLKTRGCQFQMNMLSLSRHYGKGMQKTAYELLEAGMIDFISSDAHRLEHLDKLEKIQVSKKHLEFLKPVIKRSKNLFTSS